MRNLLLLLIPTLFLGCGKLEEKVSDLVEQPSSPTSQSALEQPSLAAGSQISSTSQVMVRARVGRTLGGATTASAASVMVKSGVNKGSLDESAK